MGGLGVIGVLVRPVGRRSVRYSDWSFWSFHRPGRLAYIHVFWTCISRRNHKGTSKTPLQKCMKIGLKMKGQLDRDDGITRRTDFFPII